MSFHSINEHCYYYSGSVNIGYIHKGTDGLLIDAGLDRSSIMKVLKELNERELPLTHLFITHAHADHYGGAAYIQQNYDVYTIAPAFEEAVLKYPGLEPLYLFGGNDPLEELQNKFLQGPAITIDEVIEEGMFQAGAIEGKTYLLPGHSYHQLALRAHGILYATDSYFGVDTLHKHKIPYNSDADRTLKSLNRLLTISCDGYVPGHGELEEDASATIQTNIDYHEDILDTMENVIQAHEKGISHEELVATMCDRYHVKAPQLSQWLLYRTAVTAYAIALVKQGRAVHQIQDHRFVFTGLEADQK
ncbi:MAG: MBL fold metallo-hydrolase [Halobacillus sp.]|uniref:MBL fold metallo-hydrolase n=1 Tax=Halobacillus sp. TaxID=56800 RepID=UPI003BAF3768